MQKEIEIAVPPRVAQHKDLLIEDCALELGISNDAVHDVQILRRSIDARSKQVKYRLKCRVFINEEPVVETVEKRNYQNNYFNYC